MKTKIEVMQDARENGYYYYLDFPDHRLWLNSEIRREKTPEGKEFVSFPYKEGWVHETEEGALILRPSPQGVVHYVEFSAGAKIIRVQSPTECEVVAIGKMNDWILVNTDGNLTVHVTFTPAGGVKL